MISLTAVLFAGGESRRMGADKATLIFDGQPLWARQLATLEKMSPEKILISARTQPPWCPAEIETVLDGKNSCGPIGGLAAALEKITTAHLLALAVDLPLMTPGQLKIMLRQATPGVGVMPQSGHFFEPLGAIYPAAALPFVERQIAAGDFSLQNLAHVVCEQGLSRIHPLTAKELPLYHNVNTFADFETGLKLTSPAS